MQAWQLRSASLQTAAAPARAAGARRCCSAMALPQDQQHHSLWERVLQVYHAAQASGAATKTDTTTHECVDGGVPYVLRIASALKAKPQGVSGGASGSNGSASAPPRNPFLPYEEALWVAHLSPSHTLLLNKFNVVPYHCLVVTRAFESQADPLNAADLDAVQQVLSAMPLGGCAFYNCGEHSGRSQPHKHVQVVPLPFDEQQQAGEQHAAAPPVQQLVLDAAAAAGAAPLQPFAVRQLPHRAYAVLLQPCTPAAEVEVAAQQLLARCQAGLPSPVSYNAVMTQEWLMLVPRRQEACGNIAINALGFAGTILLRSEEDLAAVLRARPLHMLAAVGQPWSTEEGAEALL